MMNKREFRSAKDFFRKAKALKPTTAQIVDQIKQIEKYISILFPKPGRDAAGATPSCCIIIK